MQIIHREITFSSAGDTDVHDLTDVIEEIVAAGGFQSGLVTVSVAGSTVAVTTAEYEPGMIKDFKVLFNKLVPRDREWAHNLTWGDANGHSHLRASLVGPSLSLPVINGAVRRGTWQQVVCIDFDTRPRDRVVHVTVIGEVR